MTKKKKSRSSTNKTVILVLACFFLSGLTGLIYEILWTRMVVKLIGGAPFAISIILTIFMGGLGLGSFLASRTIDRIKEPIKLVKIYGLLQLIIGAYGLAIPALLIAFKPLYALLYNQLFSYFILYNLLTFIGCSIVFCIPVICMGATLPILCKFYITRLSHLGTHAGRLYGLNTIGAALGALLCGFWLISLLGVWGTLILAGLINGIIGLVCMMVRPRTKYKQQPVTIYETGNSKQHLRKDGSEQAESSKYSMTAKAALVIFAVSGFCAMAYEVIWTKLLGLIAGPTTYSFTIVLVTFILGLALGSMFFGWLGDKTKKVMWLLIFTQIAAALFALGASQLMGNSQLLFAKIIFSFQEQFALRSVLKAVILFGFMILPTLCLGATFPLVGKIYTQSVSKVGRTIGVAYAINTIGAVLGSFCAGFVLIPLIGKENGLSLVISLQLLTSLVIAFIVFSKSEKNILKRISLLTPALAGLLLCFYFPVWNRNLLSIGKYQRFEKEKPDIKSCSWLEALLQGPKILARNRSGELVYYGDGIGGFTTVLKHIRALGEIEYTMVNGGKPDATSHGDMKTQTLSAHFPMLFHQNPKTVMVLGLASGVTAGEVLYYPIEQLDVVDISREVVKASDYFRPWNNNVLSHPKTNLIVQDGRMHLELTRQKYDVIISEPSNPWMAGLATLFTRNFFALAEKSLNQGGIFVQFIHSYQMDWSTFALVGRTFAQVFENNLLILTAPADASGDYLLVGLKGKDRLTLENAKRKLSYTQQSKNVTLYDPRLLYRLIITEDLQKTFGTGPINTDNYPQLEFAAPKLMYRNDPMIARNLQLGKWLSADTKNIAQQVTTNIDTQIDFAVYALSVHAPFTNMVNLSKATPSQKERFYKLIETYYANNTTPYSILNDDELRQRCLSAQIETIQNKIDSMPDKALSYFYLANLYGEKNMPNKAIENYFKSLQIRPDFAEAHTPLGILLTKQNRLGEAIKHYNEALRIKPNFADAHNNLGYALCLQGKLDEGIIHYIEALRINPDSEETHNNLGIAFAKQGKLDKAVTHFTEALRINPDSEETHNNLGIAFAKQGKLDKAVVNFTEALRIIPDYADAHRNFAQTLTLQGKPDKAAVHSTEALRIRSDAKQKKSTGRSSN